MSVPAPGTPGHAANRLLRRRTVSGEVRGSISYHSAVDGLPTWAATLPDLSRVVGVYENKRGDIANALVFYDDSLVVFDEYGHIFEMLKYADIKDVMPFSKDPVADTLTIETREGRQVNIDVKGKPGEVSLLARFFFNVRRMMRKGSR